MRKYSIDELDIMRKCIITLYAPRPSSDYSQGYPNIRNWAQSVEDTLRTFMVNGTSPEELKEKCIKRGLDYEDAYLKYGEL